MDKINEAPTFSRVMGKFHDYTSKVINILRRKGIDEKEELDLLLITKCFSQNYTATNCAQLYLKIRENKEKEMNKKVIKEYREYLSDIELKNIAKGLEPEIETELLSLLGNENFVDEVPFEDVMHILNKNDIDWDDVNPDYKEPNNPYEDDDDSESFYREQGLIEAIIKEAKEINLPDIIDKLEDILPNYTDTEYEGDVARMDFGQERSIWVYPTGYVDYGGTLPPKLIRWMRNQGLSLNEAININSLKKGNFSNEDSFDSSTVENGDYVDFGAYGKLYVTDASHNETWRVTDIKEERNNPDAGGWYIKSYEAEGIIEKNTDNDLNEDERSDRISANQKWVENFNKFINTIWQEDVEIEFVSILEKDEIALLNKPTQGKDYVRRLYKRNESKILSFASERFLSALDNLCDLDNLESKKMNEAVDTLDKAQKIENYLMKKGFDTVKYSDNGTILMSNKKKLGSIHASINMITGEVNGTSLKTFLDGVKIPNNLKESKKLLKETGEWDDNDEEMTSWKSALKNEVSQIKKRLGKDFQVNSIRGFDKYQGPYANCSYKGKNLVFWLDEDGRLIEQNSGEKGTGQEFASILKNNLKENKMNNKKILKETSHEIQTTKFLMNYEEADVVTAIKACIAEYDGVTCSKIAAVGETQFYNVEVSINAIDDEFKDLEAKRFMIAQKLHKVRAELFTDLSSTLPVVNINMANYQFLKGGDVVTAIFTILMSQTNQRDWVTGEYQQRDKKLAKKIEDSIAAKNSVEEGLSRLLYNKK